jgi:predicted RNase H-like HicB family nuclease
MYSMLIQWSDEDGVFVVSLPEFGPYSKTHGSSYEEAAKNGREALAMLLETFEAEGRALPTPMNSGRQFRFDRRVVMSSFTIPQEFVALLGQFKERTELRDTAGKLIGVFTPQAKNDLERDEDLDAPFTLEEAERLWEEQRHLPGRPLAEFWRELKGGGRVAE